MQPLETSVVGVREAALAGHVHHQHRAARQRGEVNLGRYLDKQSASVDRYPKTKIFALPWFHEYLQRRVDKSRRQFRTLHI